MTSFDRDLSLAENVHLAVFDPEGFTRKMNAELLQARIDGTGMYSDADDSPFAGMEPARTQLRRAA